MPGTNARGHKIPLGTESSITRATIFQEFGESIRDIVPVANITARTQLVSDLTAAGEGPSSTKPLYVYRHDAPGMHRIEWTVDGTVWVPASGVLNFSNVAARDSWTLSNSAYLTAGDRCRIGSDESRWSGTVWIPGSGGKFRLTPDSVTGTGVSIGPLGEVILTAVAASTTFQIRGLFSPLFKNYEGFANWTSKPSAQPVVQGIVSTSVVGGTAYSFGRQGYVGGARTDAQGVAQASFAEGFIPILGTLGGAPFWLLAPNAPEPTYFQSQHSHLGGFAGVTNLSAALNSTDQLTGLSITTAAGGTTTGEIRFYGVA